MKNRNWKVGAFALGMGTLMLYTAPVFAEEMQSQEQQTVEVGQQEEQTESGSCGEHATWLYDKTTHTLQIGGSGATRSYNGKMTPGAYLHDQPWSAYSDEIEKVQILPGITSLGNNGFQDLVNLREVEIADTVTEVGMYAFADNPILTKVTIPNGVKELQEGAFLNCKNLNEISIPKTVTEMGGDVFKDTAWMQEQLKHQPAVVVNGILIYYENTKKKVRIPNNVTCIASDAFWFHETSELTIPDSVTTIKHHAFYYCDNLKKLVLPKSVTTIEWDFCVIKPKVIYAEKGSAAQKYAKEYNIPCLEREIKKQTVHVKTEKGKTLKLNWKKDITASGYQFQYSTDKNFKKNVKTVTVTKNTTTTKKVLKLKAGTKYFTRVRAYKTVKVNDKSRKIYGDWSTIKSTTIKK